MLIELYSLLNFILYYFPRVWWNLFLHYLLIHTQILSNILIGIYIKYLVFSSLISYLSINNQIYVLDSNLVIGSILLYFLFKIIFMEIFWYIYLWNIVQLIRKVKLKKNTFTFQFSYSRFGGIILSWDDFFFCLFLMISLNIAHHCILGMRSQMYFKFLALDSIATM